MAPYFCKVLGVLNIVYYVVPCSVSNWETIAQLFLLIRLCEVSTNLSFITTAAPWIVIEIWIVLEVNPGPQEVQPALGKPVGTVALSL